MDGDRVFVKGTAVGERDAPAVGDGAGERGREGREGDEGEEEEEHEASVEELKRQLQALMRENEQLKEELAAQWQEKAGVAEELESQTQRADALQHDLEAAKSSSGVEELTGELEKEKERARSAWRLNCEQIAWYDAELVEKEKEIVLLRGWLEERAREKSGGGSTERRRECLPVGESLTPGMGLTGGLGVEDRDMVGQCGGRRGKAPLSTRSRERILSSAWMTGCRTWNMQHSGMVGQTRSC